MNEEMTNLFAPVAAPQAFDQIQIAIASPEKIVVVVRRDQEAETINYRTFKLERDGPVLRAHFRADQGTTSAWRHKRMKNKGVICEKCGVEVTLFARRRAAYGPHLARSAGRAHLVLKSLPLRIGFCST